MFRVLTGTPESVEQLLLEAHEIEDCTEGLKRLAAEVEEDRVLSQKEKKVVRCGNLGILRVWKVEVCTVSLASAEALCRTGSERVVDREVAVVVLRVEVISGS